MKKVLFVFAVVLLFATTAQKGYAQLSDEEYNYVTMDLRGILNLTMTTSPQVDFTFKTIQEYNQGITRFNATLLEVDATLAWDLFVYASTDTWTQVEAYSTNGNSVLPAEILELHSSVTSAAPVNINAFSSLLGLTNSGVGSINAGEPTVATQFLAGAFGTGVGESFAPGTAANNPSTNKFRVDMRLKPSIPATFPNSTVLLTAAGNNVDYAQAGYYYLEVVYTLVEDL
jgi:hypothetical protein